MVPVAEPATAMALQRVVLAARPMLSWVVKVVEPRLIFSSNAVTPPRMSARPAATCERAM